MNIILAVAMVTGLYMYEYPKEVDTQRPDHHGRHARFGPGRAGIQPGDQIVQLGDTRESRLGLRTDPGSVECQPCHSGRG